METLVRFIGLPAFFTLWALFAVHGLTACTDVCEMACDAYTNYLLTCQPHDIPSQSLMCYDLGDYPDVEHWQCETPDDYRAACAQQWHDAAEAMGPLERDWARLSCERTVVWADTWGECQAMENPVGYLWPSG